MELGVARRRTLSRDEYQKLRAENACFYCRKPNARHVACDCPLKKKKVGKCGESLTFTVEVGESTGKDGGANGVAAVQSESAQSGQTKSKIAAVDGAPEEKGMQVVEDSQPVPLTNDVGLSGDEIDSLGSVLLCILGKVEWDRSEFFDR